MQLMFKTHVSRFTRFLPSVLLSAALSVSAALPLAAQSLFSPAIRVNDDVITRFELQERATFMRLLRAPGNPAELAERDLINDRLKVPLLREAGIELSVEEVEAGMDEFAARAQLSRQEFIKALNSSGVSEETFRDFVKINVAWRDYVRARFLSTARPTDAEIDRALGRDGSGSGVRVLLSEIIMPVTPQTIASVQARAEQISTVTTLAAFSSAARRHSATATRGRGGRMNWMPLSQLPAPLRPLVLALSPGEVTAPISLPNAIALFQLRDIEETGDAQPEYAAIEYAVYHMAGGRSAETLAQAKRIGETVDTCKDLYGVAYGQPEEVLEIKSQAPAEIPRDIALELAKLDDGEVSTALTSSGGQNLILVMMCGRTAAINENVNREDVANALVQQRLNARSKSLLDQLRADAVVIFEE